MIIPLNMNKKIKKIIFEICVVLMVIFSAYTAGYCQSSDADRHTLIIFHSLDCHYCIKIKQEIIPKIEKNYKDRIILEYREVGDIENYTLLLSLQEKHNVTLTGTLPVFYMNGHFINGYNNIKNGWERFIDGALGESLKEKPDILPEVDLISRFKRFTPEVIIGVGLVDGMNPCAFTVIVFFMSFMALQGYKKRELIGIGLSFIFAVFVTYFLIGLGAFGFFYRFSHFWLLLKIVNYSIGAFCIILGILAVYDFFKFKKTGKTEGLALQLPKGIRNQIHKVVGIFGRVNKSAQNVSERKFSYRLVAGSLLTGFIVALLEAVCTGQTYLPTISFILKTTPLKLQATGYLLLYNIMFVVPLVVIFVFALFGVTSERFSQILKKYLLTIKILMAVLFFGFGIFLIWRA